MDKLIEQIRNFNKERDWDQYHTPKNLSMALMVEAGELAEHFQWLTQDQSKTLNNETLEKVREEIGDVLIYLLNIADKLGINPIAAAKEKILKNANKYPANQVKGKAAKYTDL
jgi:NTP pyrophosphatase (non-canonical NTP hydrolase)